MMRAESRFRRMLALQLIYWLLAEAYNLLSAWLMHTAGYALIEGRDPWRSIQLLLLLLPVVYLGARGQHLAYVLANTALMLLLGFAGVVDHLRRLWSGGLDQYSSTWAWASAIAINGFGVAVGLTASYLGWQLLRGRTDPRFGPGDIS
jgi:uncharacterized membrane protein